MLTLLDLSSLTLLYVGAVCMYTHTCVHVCACSCVCPSAHIGRPEEDAMCSSLPLSSIPMRQGLLLNLKVVIWGVGWFQQSSCLCIPYPKCWGYRPCLTFMWVQGTPTQVLMLYSKPFPTEPPHKVIMSPWACTLLTGAHV